jgi:hypothetical protein
MSTTTTTTETINLADYFFKGSDFNWENVDLTVEKWGNKFPGEENLALHANADPADEDEPEFWIEYQNVELVFRLGVNTTVEWRPMNGAAFENTDSDTILPRDGATLLQLLELADYPDAKDIPAFWTRLLNFLEQQLEPKA